MTTAGNEFEVQEPVTVADAPALEQEADAMAEAPAPKSEPVVMTDAPIMELQSNARADALTSDVNSVPAAEAPIGQQHSDAPANAYSPGIEPSPIEEPPAEPADDLRSRLLAQFERWLDVMLAEETAPPVPVELIAEALAETTDSDPASAGTDLYTLFAALTALTGEIKLQGRAFKQLTDTMTPLAQLPAGIKDLEAAQNAVAEELDALAEELQPAPSPDSALPPSKEVLGILFDLLERLDRGLATFESGIASIKANPPGGMLARFSGSQRSYHQMLATIEAMHEGQRLTLSRLQAAIEQWGIQRVGRKGDMFDPASMTAIEIETTSAHPEGSVVEIYRSGYMFHGQLLAASQVKVAKRK